MISSTRVCQLCKGERVISDGHVLTGSHEEYSGHFYSPPRRYIPCPACDGAGHFEIGKQEMRNMIEPRIKEIDAEMKRLEGERDRLTEQLKKISGDPA